MQLQQLKQCNMANTVKVWLLWCYLEPHGGGGGEWMLPNGVMVYWVVKSIYSVFQWCIESWQNVNFVLPVGPMYWDLYLCIYMGVTCITYLGTVSLACHKFSV